MEGCNVEVLKAASADRLGFRVLPFNIQHSALGIWPLWHHDGMRTTIDKAGRVVIPAAVREKAGLAPGTALEITVDDTGVRLERVAPGPKLVRVGRRLVARPTAATATRPDLDVGALIEDERNRWP